MVPPEGSVMDEIHDPFGDEDNLYADDACTAIGIGVLDVLSSGAAWVMVKPAEEGWEIAGYDIHERGDRRVGASDE
jgi:hypothetical protein